MNTETVRQAEVEARRFLAAVVALNNRRKKEAAKERIAKATDGQDAEGYLFDFQGCRESGAVRRASLDLTRALADLRKP